MMRTIPYSFPPSRVKAWKKSTRRLTGLKKSKGISMKKRMTNITDFKIEVYD